MQARRERLVTRAKKRRQLACDIMVEVDLKKVPRRTYHKDPDERAWWQTQGIEPLEIARMLWEDSHADHEHRDIDHNTTTCSVD